MFYYSRVYQRFDTRVTHLSNTFRQRLHPTPLLINVMVRAGKTAILHRSSSTQKVGCRRKT